MLDTTQPKQNRKRKLPDSFYHTIPKPKRRKLTHRYKEHCKQDVKDRKSYSEEPKISHDSNHVAELNHGIPSLNVFNDSRSQYASDNDDDGSDTESVSTESSIAQNVIQSQPSTPVRNIIIHHNAECLSQSVKRAVQSNHSSDAYFDAQAQCEPLQSAVTNIYDEPPIARKVVALRHKSLMDSNKDRNVYLLFALVGVLIGFIVCLSVYHENQLNYANAKEVMDIDEPRVYDIAKNGYKNTIDALEYEIGECHVEWGSCEQLQRQKDKLDQKRVAEITKQKNKFALCNQQLKRYKENAKRKRSKMN